jgi:alpha-galactosidase
MLGAVLGAIAPASDWLIVKHWNAVGAGEATTQPSLAECEAAAAGGLQFSFNLHSGHCFASNSTTFAGSASDHITSGCIQAAVTGCRQPPPTPPPTPPPPLTPDFPPLWNGLARTPPMGWRSWNAFGATTNQVDMEAMVELIASPDAFAQPAGESLASLGYSDVGLDEGWEGCGEGANGTQHDATGLPVTHTRSFPDLRRLTDRAHGRGLTVGWYQNGCACGESVEELRNYEGDVTAALALGFDGVKFDGCGKQNNHTRYARLFNATGKAFLMENCHAGDCTLDDNSGCATREWCPFNLFRASRDIDNTDTRWFLNLQAAIRFLDREAPVSQPGCWAYGDMMQIGRLSTFELSRAHFGAWAITSMPLVFSLDLRQTEAVQAVWPILSNSEAIAINQKWAGHAGYLHKQWAPQRSAKSASAPAPALFATMLGPGQSPASHCNSSDVTQAGWWYDASLGAVRFDAGGGGSSGSSGSSGSGSGSGSSGSSSLCLDSTNRGHLTLAACDSTSRWQRFTCEASAGEPCLLQQPGTMRGGAGHGVGDDRAGGGSNSNSNSSTLCVTVQVGWVYC